MKFQSHRTLLRLIAVFKLVKAALLIAVAVGALKLLHRDVGQTVQRWAEASGINPDTQFMNSVVEKASALNPQRIKALSLGSMIYAGLFLTEGLGLWFLKRWAEWFTTIITTSLVPIEVYEIHQHPTPLKVAVRGVSRNAHSWEGIGVRSGNLTILISQHKLQHSRLSKVFV